MTEAGASGGLLASLRRMFATVLEIGQVRLHILGNELEQEKLRLFDGLIVAAIGLMLTSIGAVLLCALIIMLFAEGYRIVALAVMTIVFIGGGILAMRAGGQRLRAKTHMFQATLAEIAQDREALAPRE
ncbi:phage holin family protein [Caenimonas koreensis DSM 17982]|uniref:Phage holin family protein n=1 Tax=Caenimonas koreensis DSM 17982 TaxID=1121255 RepID=A0A844B5G2_9BURK|nr:phage holin family protein [Caenimonas koreensis]MRD46556.1 phage holin family protein [Caenimonas koreensis DSM 17982]